MVNNKLKVGLGLLTVLATPIAVNSLTSSEVHAAEQKTAVVEKSATAEKTATDSKQNVAEKPATAEKSDNKAVVADRKTTEKLADNEKTEAIGKQEIVEKSISEEKQSESVKQEEILKNTLPKEGGKPSDGKEEDKTGYDKGIFYDNGKLANWWYDDGQDWYFFQNGKKHTGEGKDNAGNHYFVNGKYANGYQNGTYYVEGKAANWWYDDGTAWYFFQNGKKYTGEGKDNEGYHYFVNGKYENNVPALNMPQYYQSDARWGKKVYGLANLDDSGCVPTSLAMAFSGLGKSVTPIDVADVIYNNTNAFNKIGMGTTGAGADYAIKYYNFKNTVIKTKSQLVQALQSGNPVLALVGKGYFVKKYYNSHAVILSGYQNGETKALDPDNAANTGKWYNVDGIWNQRSLNPLNAMLGGSFMLIEKK